MILHSFSLDHLISDLIERGRRSEDQKKKPRQLFIHIITTPQATAEAAEEEEEAKETRRSNSHIVERATGATLIAKRRVWCGKRRTTAATAATRIATRDKDDKVDSIDAAASVSRRLRRGVRVRQDGHLPVEWKRAV